MDIDVVEDGFRENLGVILQLILEKSAIVLICLVVDLLHQPHSSVNLATFIAFLFLYKRLFSVQSFTWVILCFPIDKLHSNL